FFHGLRPTQSHTLSLHDALPILAASLVAFHVHNDVRAALKLAAHDQPRDVLECVQRVTMPPDKNAKVVAANVQNPGRVLLVRCRSEEHTSELQSRENLVCRLLLE